MARGNLANKGKIIGGIGINQTPRDGLGGTPRPAGNDGDDSTDEPRYTDTGDFDVDQHGPDFVPSVTIVGTGDDAIVYETPNGDGLNDLGSETAL